MRTPPLLPYVYYHTTRRNRSSNFVVAAAGSNQKVTTMTWRCSRTTGNMQSAVVSSRLFIGNGNIPTQQQQQQQQQIPCREKYCYYPYSGDTRRHYHELSFAETGNNLSNVLQYCRDETVDDLDPPPPPLFHPDDNDDDDDNDEQSSFASSWVRVALEAAPWNPADWNTIQGRYPTLPLPLQQLQHLESLTSSRYFENRTVVGAQGIGRVTHIVREVNNNNNEDHRQQQQYDGRDDGLQIGDWVTAGIPSFGSYRSSIWVPARTSTRTRYVRSPGDDYDGKSTMTTMTITRSEALLILRGKRQQGDRAPIDQYLRASRHRVAAASMLFQLGGTALRMLRDFGPPQEEKEEGTGLVVLQNAGNSGVGFMVAQCLKHFYHDTNTLLVSLVRRGHRSDKEVQAMVEYLSSSSNGDNGNNNQHHVVLIEDDLINDRKALRAVQINLMDLISSEINNNGPPSFLALNSVGGHSADLLLQLLQRLSSSTTTSTTTSPPTMVTYGGMSQEPITVKTGSLVFHNLALRGYWHSRWLAENAAAASPTNMEESDDPRQALLEELVEAAIVQQRIQLPPVDLVSMSVDKKHDDDGKDVISRLIHHSKQQSLQPIRHKLVLDLAEP